MKEVFHVLSSNPQSESRTWHRADLSRLVHHPEEPWNWLLLCAAPQLYIRHVQVSAIVPLSLPDPASQTQAASAICNLPTISFGQVVSQGHGTVPSTAKPVGFREVDWGTHAIFSVNPSYSIFFVMVTEWGLLYDLSECCLVLLDHYSLIEERSGLAGELFTAEGLCSCACVVLPACCFVSLNISYFTDILICPSRSSLRITFVTEDYRDPSFLGDGTHYQNYIY